MRLPALHPPACSSPSSSSCPPRWWPRRSRRAGRRRTRSPPRCSRCAAGVDVSTARPAALGARGPDELRRPGVARRAVGGRRLARAAERPPVVLTEPVSTDGVPDARRHLARCRPRARTVPSLVTARTRTDGQLDRLVRAAHRWSTAAPSRRRTVGSAPCPTGPVTPTASRCGSTRSATPDPRDVRADLIEPGTSDADAAITGAVERVDGHRRPPTGHRS